MTHDDKHLAAVSLALLGALVFWWWLTIGGGW